MSTQLFVTSVPISTFHSDDQNYEFEKANLKFNLELEIAKEEIRLLRNKISILQLELNQKSELLMEHILHHLPAGN